MKTTFEKNATIPIGSELRVLLNSEHISYGEIHNTLKKKGIFVGNSDKRITVPILSATLLTFKEFSSLIESSIDRESRPKGKVSPGLELVAQDADWITPLKKDLFTSTFNPCTDIETIDFVDAPIVVVDSKDKVKIPYTLTRRDYSKEWVRRELYFSGEIVIERQGNSLKLDFSSIHSSRETELINKRLRTRIFKILKNAGATTSETEQRITFESFSTEERVRFFKRLTGGIAPSLNRGSVNDIEINRGAHDTPLPDDPQVAWMNQTVKRLKIDGEKLNEIFLISDEKYYSYYHIQHMDVTFTFTSAANQGKCRVGFYFSSPLRSSDRKDEAELTFEVISITPSNQMNSDATKKLTGTLDRAIRKMIESEFEKIVSERITTPRAEMGDEQ